MKNLKVESATLPVLPGSVSLEQRWGQSFLRGDRWKIVRVTRKLETSSGAAHCPESVLADGSPEAGESG